MKNKKFNAALVWKQLEDLLVPRLAPSVRDRAVYSHLVRHSRLEGKRRLRFSIPRLARGVRQALLPEEIRAAVPREGEPHGLRGPGDETRGLQLSDGRGSGAASIEELDFLTRDLRKEIHARERGQCFCCLRRIASRMQGLDHVLPRAQRGRNSYRNLVSCCLECSSRKGEMAAKDFLRWLYREQRLSTNEFGARLRALEDLAAGKLRPALAGATNPTPRKGRPPLTLTKS
jgi:hypothetical protein